MGYWYCWLGEKKESREKPKDKNEQNKLQKHANSQIVNGITEAGRSL